MINTILRIGNIKDNSSWIRDGREYKIASPIIIAPIHPQPKAGFSWMYSTNTRPVGL